MSTSESAEYIERIIRIWMSTGDGEEVQTMVHELKTHHRNLTPVVKALGPYLTSEEDEQRSKGVEFLAEVVSQYPSDNMNRQSVRTLVTFFCAKLEDTETIIPAMKGLVSTVQKEAFAAENVEELVRALFRHVKMKVLAQANRFLVFTIIDTLLAHHREVLKAMGKDFLHGYLGLADGEKDPRNLLLAFAIARVILIEFDVSALIEEFYNVTFCYFPITFRPPPDDPYGITSEDLKLKLRDCLNATPLFGPMGIPLFIEKLIAGSPTTKRDTLQTMDICLPVYGPVVAREHARKLWNTLKLEIFQPTDGETESMALNTTQVLIQTIYPENAQEGAEIEGLAKDACEECIRILKEPEKSQAKPASKVLCAFMLTTPPVARFTLSQGVPHFVKLFLNPDEASNRPPTLRLLADLIVAARDSAFKDSKAVSQDSDVPLSPYKDEVLGVFTVGLKSANTSKQSLDGLLGMVTTRGLLTDEELGFVVHNANELLLGEGGEDEQVRDGILRLFTAVSSENAFHITDTTLPLLFTSLPDRAPARSEDSERLKYWRTLSFLKKLCIHADLFEMLVVRLSTKLELLCSPRAGSSDDGDEETTAAYAHSILRTLADALKTKVDGGHPDVPKYIDRLVPRLYHLHIYSALVSEEGKYAVPGDPKVVAVSAEIITLVIQTQNSQRQKTFYESLFAVYFDKDAKQIADSQPKLPEDVVFAPFASPALAAQKALIPLFAAAIFPIRKDVSLPIPTEHEFLNVLFQWAVNESDTLLQRESIFQVISTLTNKRWEHLRPFWGSAPDNIWSAQVVNAEVPIEKRRRSLLGWIWITKALLVTGHPEGVPYAERLFQVFGNKEISWEAARAVGEIVATDKVLTKKNNAIVKILHAQRYFQGLVDKIAEGAKIGDDPDRQNTYLVALTALIKPLPKTVYASALPKLMPLLLRGLELPDAEIRANIIDTLLATADTSSTDKNAVVAEHATSLVSTMLKNCVVKDMPSVRLRVSALRYLAVLPGLVRYDVLHPQKATVVRELAKVLDDPKRAVRKEAVEARTNWFKFTG